MRLAETVRTASFRLAVGYALLFALSALAVGAFAYLSVNTALEQQRRARIDAEIAFLEQKYRSEGLPELTEEVQERLDTTIANGLDYLVLGQERLPLSGNLTSIPDGPGWHEVEYPRAPPATGVDRVRLHIVDLDDTVRLAVGDDFETADAINAAVGGAIAWWALVLAAVAVSGGALASFAMRRQIGIITRTADAIVEGDLRQRIPLRHIGGDFDRLSASLNRMLDRIGELMESLRQVSNDVAHSLRSPLTRLKQRLEAAREEATTNDDWNLAAQGAIAEIDTVLETFSALLRIAQVESGTERAGFAEIDLSALFIHVADAFAPVASEEGKTLSAEIAAGVRTFGDKDLLTQLLANLIENAIQYTPPGARIDVRLSAEGPTASIADNGPGVAEAERPRIFERFYRAAGPRGPSRGVGLGLALASAIAKLHGIALTAEDNRPGLRMVMRFGDALAGAQPVRPVRNHLILW